VLIDHALGLADIERLGEAARLHATQRIVMFTPATRQELQPTATPPHRLSGQAAARGFARGAPDGRAGSGRAEPGAGDRPDRDTAAPSAKGLSILVAEDNQINALLIRSLLGRLGHHAVITTNGAEALESWLSAKSAGTPMISS
jgi:hypothetical protein